MLANAMTALLTQANRENSSVMRCAFFPVLVSATSTLDALAWRLVSRERSALMAREGAVLTVMFRAQMVHASGSWHGQ